MYWTFMERYYGREVIDELIKESAQTVKYTAADFEAIESDFKTKTQQLLDGTYPVKLKVNPVNVDLPF